MKVRCLSRFELSMMLADRMKDNLSLALMIMTVDISYIKSSLLDLYVDVFYQDLLGCINSDCCVVSLGVNEFALVMNGSGVIKYEEVFGLLSGKKLLIGEDAIVNSISAGVSIYPGDAYTSDDLIHVADVASNVSKLNGHSKVVCYSLELERRHMPGCSLAQAQEIIRNGYAVYQPIMDCTKNKVLFYEALIRHENIATSDMLRGCSHYNLWHEVFEVIIGCVIDDSEFISEPISINISPSQIFNAESLFMRLRYAEKCGFNLSRLIVEVTENEQVKDGDYALFMQNLQALKKMGIKIGLDDFGAGFSFFNRLRTDHFDYIKIDRHIVSGVHHVKEKQALIKSIKLYCDELNKLLIAEGVESSEDVDFLIATGVSLMQGYAFSHPVDICNIKQ